VQGLPPGAAPAAVAAGGAHTVVLLDDGRVYTFGLNDYGQLGHSPAAAASSSPQLVAGLPADVVKVAASHFHTLALTRSGELWAFGRNKERQLGLGADAPAAVRAPSRVQLDDVVGVAAGARHSLAVTRSGALYSWGARELLGLGAERWSLLAARFEHAPRLVRALRGVRVCALAAGGAHSAVTDADGRLYVFGDNSFNQLGAHVGRAAAEPVAVAGVHAVASVAAGSLHTVTASHDGDVHAWGANECGALGLGLRDTGPANEQATPSRVPGVALTAVSAGWKHSAGITAAGDLFAWGWGGAVGSGADSSGGQLGLDNEFDYWSPAQVPLEDGVRAVAVSCGWNHSAGILFGGP
jgi:alpha-tubulin suppressor-like RCC1 family protein